MFDRMKLLFAPIPSPADASKKWLGVERGCREWQNGRCTSISNWKDNTSDIKNAVLGVERSILLTAAVEAGRNPRKQLLDFESLYRPKKPQELSSHVYLSKGVMDQLDQLYVNHYRNGKGGLSLHHCFETMMDCEEDIIELLKAHQNYLEDVKTLL